MAIALAVQRGNLVYVYDERNRQIFSMFGKLHGYTSSTVAIVKGNLVYTYDEKGRFITSRSAR